MRSALRTGRSSVTQACSLVDTPNKIKENPLFFFFFYDCEKHILYTDFSSKVIKSRKKLFI